MVKSEPECNTTVSLKSNEFTAILKLKVDTCITKPFSGESANLSDTHAFVEETGICLMQILRVLPF